ncbi:MAG: DUF3090 domain-containing protein [Acidothermus sp.]|nr:DUF3090 domain-containing protein [Acidothermus sp.]MCL6537990.1 DUF3090 domain-containing protein [Acidothermus sp.]
MPRQVFNYETPDRVVIGAVGEPGRRTFFLQVREADRLTSVVLEKAQVAVLAERLDAMLDEVVRVSGGTASVPAVAPSDLDDDRPLDEPLIEEFRVGALGLGWDPETEQVVIEAQALGGGEAEEVLVEDDDAEGPPLLRVRMSGAVARAFAKRALKVVAAGRPACEFCGEPIDPEGHICARANGHKRP